jgi:hypothetical protein
MYPFRWTIVVLALCASLCAQTGVRISPRDSTALVNARTAVRRYCEMDAQGFRLDADSAKRMQDITTAKAPPEWHSFQVISEYRIGAARINSRGVLVPVTYTILGRFDVGDGYTDDPRSETVELQTVAGDGGWKVENDDLAMPYVLRVQALKWLRESAGTEKDPVRKHALEQALRELQ